MKVYEEISISEFEFWSGACRNANELTSDELDSIESELACEYPEGISDTELNDLFWFDFEYICNIIGLTESEVDERED